LPQKPHEQLLTNTPPCSIECNIIDRSDSGYCLKWEHSHSSQLKTNELIGVLEDNDSEHSHWTIAVIRWIKTTDATHKLIGIETLSLNAIPISLQPENNISDASPTKGLFISKILKNQSPFVIITPKLSFKPKEQSQITTQEKSYTARFTQDLALSPLYAFWEVELDEAQPPNNPIAHTIHPPHNS